MSNSIKTRLRKCFDETADKYNGRLICPLIGSSIFYDSFAYRCADEFIQELYEEWCQLNVDKGINQNGGRREECIL